MRFWRHARVLAGVLLTALLVAPGQAPAAEDVEAAYEAGDWGTRFTFGLNLLQSYYTENWNGGDKGSVVWASQLDGLAKKRLSDDLSFTGTLNLAFGQSHQQEREDDSDELYWRRPDKTTDEIRSELLLRYLRSALDPFVSVRFESQFIDQTDPRRDFTLNPLEFYETVGISRQFIADDERQLLARLGFTLHQSLRDIYLGAGTVETESTNDGGIELIFDYRSEYFDEAVDYVGELRFYQPVYYAAKSDIEDLDAAVLAAAGLDTDLADYTTTLDIDFKNHFTAHITDVINVQLLLRWVYDKYDNTVPLLTEGGVIENPEAVTAAVRKSGQFKQTMSLGVAYTF